MESPLARIREERGYTTRSLAQRLGMSPNTISEIERGVTVPNADTLRRLADALNTTMDALWPSEKERKHHVLNDITSSAASLYDGGWRASDRDQLTAEYNLPDEDADALCAALADMESSAPEVTRAERKKK